MQGRYWRPQGVTALSRCGNVPFMESGRVCLWLEGSAMRKCHEIFISIKIHKFRRKIQKIHSFQGLVLYHYGLNSISSFSSVDG